MQRKHIQMTLFMQCNVINYKNVSLTQTNRSNSQKHRNLQQQLQLSSRSETVYPPSHDLQQFAYRANWSAEDAVTLHRALRHLENKKSYVRMFFVDCSSAFSTINPDILNTKLDHIHIPLATCSWIKDSSKLAASTVTSHRIPAVLHSQPRTVGSVNL